MARKPRLDVPGTVHHVMVRGWGRGDLFQMDAEREAFLERVEDSLTWGGAQCFAWALMTNHCHLVLLRGRRPLAKVMHRIDSWFASFLNRRYGRRSGVLDGRYKAVLVDHDEYLTELVRYVHLNPVRAGIISLDGLARYPWTGHAALMGNGLARFLSGSSV